MYAASRIGRSLPARCDAYQLPYRTKGIVVDKRLVDAIHAAEKQIHLWTVNEAEEMAKFLDMGVDGIISDRPDILNEVIEERARARG
jgi:glycerophosphoryl diester phosphodiesterase